jgi:hypothetical protein
LDSNLEESQKLDMKQVSLSTTSFFLSFAFAVFWTTKAIVKIPGNETIPAVLMFGDSIVDTGNNNKIKSIVKCNFPPYGREFKEGIPTGRFSNGKVPSDFLGLLQNSLSLSLSHGVGDESPTKKFNDLYEIFVPIRK